MTAADQPVAIVPVDPGNIDAATALLVRFFAEEGFGTSPEACRRNLHASLGDGIGWAALAHLGSIAMGVATVQLSRSVEQGLPAEIGDLWVAPDARGSGVARMLVEACCDWAAAQGSHIVHVTMTAEGDARHNLSGFYDRLGFRHTGRVIRSRQLNRS